MRVTKSQESMPVAFISMTEDAFALYGDDVRRICSHNGIDPDGFGWPDPVGAESATYVRGRIASARLFIGIYQMHVQDVRVIDPDNSDQTVSSTAFDLATACRLFKRSDVLCFLQRNVERSEELEEILLLHKRSYEAHEFDDQRDLWRSIDAAVKQWMIENFPGPERGSVLSVQVECRDRYGVLARLTERIFQEGGNILRAEHRNHLHRSFIRIIVSWPVRETPDPATVKGKLEQALEELFGVGIEDGRVVVAPVIGLDGTVETRGIFRIMFWDGRGVAERILAVLADDKLSIVESHLATIPTSPALGSLELMVNAGGSHDDRLGLVQNRLQREPNVLFVERSTERGKWWY
jgi:hypothetical protein